MLPYVLNSEAGIVLSLFFWRILSLDGLMKLFLYKIIIH